MTSSDTDLGTEHLMADVEQLRAEAAKIRAETDKKLAVEIAKLLEETKKTQRESAFYPFVVGSGVTLAIVAIAKLFL